MLPARGPHEVNGPPAILVRGGASCSRLIDEDLSRLGDGLDLVGGLEVELLGRPTSDCRDDLNTGNFHDHLRHHVPKLDRLDRCGQMIASAEHLDWIKGARNRLGASSGAVAAGGTATPAPAAPPLPPA